MNSVSSRNLFYYTVLLQFWKVFFSIWSFSRLNWNHLTFCPGARWRWVISTTWITLNFNFYLKLKVFSPYLASKPLMQGRASFHGKNYRCHQSRQKSRTRSVFQLPRIFLLEILPRKIFFFWKYLTVVLISSVNDSHSRFQFWSLNFTSIDPGPALDVLVFE